MVTESKVVIMSKSASILNLVAIRTGLSATGKLCKAVALRCLDLTLISILSMEEIPILRLLLAILIVILDHFLIRLIHSNTKYQPIYRLLSPKPRQSTCVGDELPLQI